VFDWSSGCCREFFAALACGPPGCPHLVESLGSLSTRSARRFDATRRTPGSILSGNSGKVKTIFSGYIVIVRDGSGHASASIKAQRRPPKGDPKGLPPKRGKPGGPQVREWKYARCHRPTVGIHRVLTILSRLTNQRIHEQSPMKFECRIPLANF